MKEPNDNIDKQIDELLVSFPLEPKADFTSDTLAKLQAAEAEKNAKITAIDDSLDTLLAKQDITPSADFSEKVLARLAEEESTKVVAFPSWAYSTIAVAACIFAVFFIFAQINPSQKQDAMLASHDDNLKTEEPLITAPHTPLMEKQKERDIEEISAQVIQEPDTNIASNTLQVSEEEIGDILEMNDAIESFPETIASLKNAELEETWALLTDY